MRIVLQKKPHSTQDKNDWNEGRQCKKVNGSQNVSTTHLKCVILSLLRFLKDIARAFMPAEMQASWKKTQKIVQDCG